VQLREEIRRVQRDVGTTTLFVTHDQEEALAVADRVGVMNAGRLDQLAPPAELYAAPATPFVGQFVGLSNRIPAHSANGSADVLGTAVPTLEGSATGSGEALVRPEAVRVRADEAGTATVATVAFLGPISRVTLTLPDGTLVTAQLPSADATSLQVGVHATVTVDPVPVLVVAD
jgi:putative spermidine/putrescine transport system ATP-binding protein